MNNLLTTTKVLGSDDSFNIHIASDNIIEIIGVSDPLLNDFARNIIMHEIGHALGIAHAPNSDWSQIMENTDYIVPITNLHEYDIEALHEHYNTCDNNFTSEFYNLNNNEVPTGWQLSVLWPEVILNNGKLIAKTIDAYGGLWREGTIPAGTSKMKFEWDGSLQPSFWGMDTQLRIDFGTNEYFLIYAQNAGVNNAVSNRVFVYHYQGTTQTKVFEKQITPVSDNYHFTVELSPNSINYIATSLSSSATYFNETVSIPSSLNFSFDKVKSIRYLANATTDNDCWLDNISVQVIP